MKTSKIFKVCIILAFSFYSLFQDLAASELENNQSSNIYRVDSEPSSLLLLKNYYKIDLSNIESKTKGCSNLISEEKESSNISNKSPWLAFFLSLYLPGVGQWYNGDYAKALVMEGLVAIGLGFAYFSLSSINFDSESNPDYLGVMAFLGLLFGGAGWLWSVIDAPITANNINERNQKKMTILNGTILEYQEIKFGFAAGIKSEKYSLELNFKYNIP